MEIPAGIAQSFAILRLSAVIARRPEVLMEDNFKRAIAAFERAGIPWAVIGAQAVNMYVRPRATVDVDFVVDGRRMKKVLAALEAEFGPTRSTDIGAAVRLESLALDLVRSETQPLFRAVLDTAVEREGVRVPPPELLVALKFMSSTSNYRDPNDRRQDAVDLARVVTTLGDDLDRKAALEYAKLVFPGAERELAAMFDAIDRGDRLVF